MSTMKAGEHYRKDVRVIFIPARDMIGMVKQPIADYQVTGAEVISQTGGEDSINGVLVTLEGVIP